MLKGWCHPLSDYLHYCHWQSIFLDYFTMYSIEHLNLHIRNQPFNFYGGSYFFFLEPEKYFHMKQKIKLFFDTFSSNISKISCWKLQGQIIFPPIIFTANILFSIKFSLRRKDQSKVYTILNRMYRIYKLREKSHFSNHLFRFLKIWLENKFSW